MQRLRSYQFSFSIQAVFGLMVIVAVFVSIALWHINQVAKENSIIEFQNVGFELVSGHDGKRCLLYFGPRNQIVTVEQVPNFRHLTNIDSVQLGDCRLAEDVVSWLTTHGVEIRVTLQSPEVDLD